MILEFRRRTTRGLSLQANWTLAKAIDDVGTNVQTAALDVLSPGRDRANSDYARRHGVTLMRSMRCRLKETTRWALPCQSGPIRWLAAGTSAASGTDHGPLSHGNDECTRGTCDERPDVVPGVTPNLSFSERSRNHWFNPAAFTQPPLLDLRPNCHALATPAAIRSSGRARMKPT